MTSPNEDEKPKVTEKTKSIRRESFKVVFYILILAVSLSIMNFLFGWASEEEVPSVLKPLSSIITLVNPYLPYIQSVLIFALGYLVVNAVSAMTYAYMRRITDHPTAATIRTMTRISGLAVLLSMIASVFNVNPTAALTIGSFGGLVVGFATQTILSHVVAGIFLLISRPY
ncbi:MAG: mechanosensitive ion channel family protein, partial [Candidatus Brockarchaeota archaeon]|nr:mechanosensitive ion channel family protein [Candidatus Brockarchaeota archaeon]